MIAEFFLVLYLGGHGVLMPERYTWDACRTAGENLTLIDGNGEKKITAVTACVPAPAKSTTWCARSNGDGTHTAVPCK